MRLPSSRFLPGRRTLLVLAAVHVVVLLAGFGIGLVLARDLPSIGNLDLLRLPQMTVLLDRNGGRLHSFAEQRRTPVTLDRISPHLVKALLATEDPRFERHVGVDLQAVGRAVYANIRRMRWGAQGGSTITQQLARDTFLYPKKTLRRKIEEALLALAIEKNYTKREILELYCNRIYLGHGRYGMEAAAEFYFGKQARDLTLPEAALLAGLPQRPEGHSPLKSPRAALARRNHVLDRMVAEGVLDKATATRAKAQPLGIARARERRAAAEYFVEEVRRFLLRQFGEEALYRSGLLVRTTLDPRLQLAAERAVRAGLDEYGRRHRMVPEGRPLPEGQSATDYEDAGWGDTVKEGDIVAAVALSSGPTEAELRIGADRMTLTAADMKWTGRKFVNGVLKPGRIYHVKVLETSGSGRPVRLELASVPPVEAAFMAVDAHTGEVLALVGGKDFDRSEFNRATQAARQAGSAIKPFIYTAALERGFTAGSQVWDVPTVWTEPGSPEPYQPENYDLKYEGLITFQEALEHSRNVPTVRLLDALGYQPMIEMATRLGVKSKLKPYPSLALGAFEVRLSELVSAYGSFVNGGVLVTPQMVRSVQSADGQDLWSSHPESKEVLAPEVAAGITAMLRGTTTRGTAAVAAKLGRPTIGKTGTTNDFSDAWFIGATPSIAAGAWLGYDQRQSLGRGETGGKAALPIWMKFMEEGFEGRPAEPFGTPPGVEAVELDLLTGYRVNPAGGCAKPIAAIVPPPQDGQPPRDVDRACTARDHLRAMLPYQLQPFPITPAGALVIAPAEVARLIAMAPDKFQMVGAGKELRYAWGDKMGSIMLAWAPRDWARFLTELTRATEFAAGVPPDLGGTGRRFGSARGHDGWPAEILTVNRTGEVQPLGLPKDP